MYESEKEVYFNEYCYTCKHHDKREEENPCDICLSCPYRTNSHKPIKWEEAE